MDRRRAGALLALAACIATTAAAPTASNPTALDLYEGGSEGCYYNFQHYGEGDRIMTNEPCLNCTCHNRMLMCYLRVCPFTKPIGQDCSVEKRADQCCPIVTCPDVPVDLLTSTSTSSPAEYGETGLGKLDRYGCSINGKYFPEGSKVPPTPNKPCEHCYCIRNMTTCVMQECTLHVDGCTPIYRKDVCCPVRYSCDHPEDEIPLLDDMTTTVRPTPGFLLTTTTLSPVTQMTQDCMHDDKIFADGALIRTEKACEHCYCMKGDIVCVVQECGTPMENEGKNCTSMPPREGQCCPDTYICEGDEVTTEPKPDIATVTSKEDITTLSPPRRVSVEGSGYRSETDEPFTEAPTFEPDTEGSGEDQQPYKPSDEKDMFIPENETSSPSITTEKDETAHQYSPSTTEVPIIETDIADKVTTEPDKGENTVPSGLIEEDRLVTAGQATTPETETTSSKQETATELAIEAETTSLPKDESHVKVVTAQEETTATEPAATAETTMIDLEMHSSSDNMDSTQRESFETTGPTRRKEGEVDTAVEPTTEKYSEEVTTKSKDLTGLNTLTTESTTPFVEQEAQTPTSQIPEKESEVSVQEPATDLNLDLTTKLDVVEAVTQSVTTLQQEVASEVSTPGKVDLIETTSVNPIENEIDEETFPTSVPGRIPGEGDCLRDGITYSHESIIPSSNKCTICRCISSDVKCEPITCSPPPDYMDNCQPTYDTPESCCPTYVCDHPRETVPPQSHSQMAGTESPVPTPTIECEGDQCEIVKDKEHVKPSEPCTSEDCTDDSSKKPDDCGSQGCSETENKPKEPSPLEPHECVGNSCSQTPEKPVDCGSQGCSEGENKPKEPHPLEPHGCVGNSCSQTPEKPVDCGPQGCSEVENKPKEPHPLEPHGCVGNSCSQTPEKPIDCGSQGCSEVENKPKEPHPLEPHGCVGNSCSQTPEQCANGKCDTAIPKDQTCNNENGCNIPVPQTCEGENCSVQPDDSAIKDDTSTCDNANDCKGDKLPEKLPNCEGESCISEIPPENIPQEKQDCKDGNDCGQSDQTSVKECNEEGCRRQDVPDVNKPAPSNCTGAECSQQDHKQQITDTPEINKATMLSVTELPESPETKYEETVTDLPKTTAIEKEIEPSRSTEASILDEEEEIGTTTSSDKLDKEKEPQPSESPETITKMPAVQAQDDSVTDKITDGETTTGLLHDITKAEEMLPEVNPALSALPTTEIPIISDLDNKEDKQTSVPESVTSPIQEKPITYPPEDADKDKDANDITTAEPSPSYIDNTSPEISQETTESQETLTLAPESLDRDGHEEPTKEPEYVQDTEPKVTEPAEVYTTSPKQISTNKFEVEPIEEQGSQGALTTPTSYDSQNTDVPLTFNTNITVDLSTIVPEIQTTFQQEDKKEPPELSEDKSRPDEVVTSKPDDTILTTVSMLSSGAEEGVQTMAPVVDDNENTKPDVSLTKDGQVTQAPYLFTTLGEESSKMTTIHDIVSDSESQTESSEPRVTTFSSDTVSEESDVLTTEDKHVETPAPVTIHVQTETPMSIVKDRNDDEINITRIPETEITTKHDDLIPKTPESLDSDLPLPTESETQSDKTAPDNEKMSTMSAEKDAAATTETSIVDLETTISPLVEDKLPTEELVHDSQVTIIPESEINTDNTPGSVPVSEHQEPSVTEAGIQKFSVSEEKSTEKAPITPSEDIDTKTSDSVTESLEQSTGGGVVITPGHEQMNDYTESTELPELTIHEHPTEPSSIAQEPEQSVTEETASDAPGVAVTEPQGIPEKDTSDTPIPQDVVTKAPQESTSQPEKEVTKIPEQELITTSPELSKTDATASEVDDTTSHIPDISATESQTGATTEVQATPTRAPEITTEKEGTETPVPQDVVPSGPKISETEPQETGTEGQEPASVTTAADIFVTESHKDITEAPESHDVVTSPSITFTTETQKESTGVSEIQDIEPQEITYTPEKQDIMTVAPELPDFTTKSSEISPPESHEKATQEPQSQDKATNAPNISETEPQEVVTKVPEYLDEVTNVTKTPETVPKKYITETSMPQDITTSVPAVSVTESEPTDDKYIPVVLDISPTTPEISEGEPEQQTTDGPAQEDTSDIPVVDATGPQKEVTEAPVAEDTVTKVPDISITDSQTYRPQSPESQDTATSAPESAETEPKKETTEIPESQEGGVTSPEMSQTEPKKEIAENPETLITDAPGTLQTESQEQSTIKPDSQDADSKSPGTITTEYYKEVTPEIQDMVTKVTDITPTESQKAPTETQEISDKTITETQKPATESPESQDIVTDLPVMFVTESQQEPTDAPIPPTIVTNAPEIFETETEKEAPEPELITKAPQVAQTEDKAEPEYAVTEKGDMSSEPPLKITTKLDDSTQTERQEFVTPTEPSKIEADTLLPSADGSLAEQSTRAPESLTTEPPEKTTDSDTATEHQPAEDMVAGGEKPQKEPEIATQKPFEEPIQTTELVESEKSDFTTESPISAESFEPETQAPQLEIGSGDTITPSVTEKQDYTHAPEIEPIDSRQTEATIAPNEEKHDANKAPETLGSQDKTTQSSELSEETSVSKDEYPETTPYLVILEEHTHKKDIYTAAPDEEITTSPSSMPEKEDEPLVPEDSIDKVTESAPGMETEKPVQEDDISNKGQNVPELTQTTISERITEPSLVSQEVTTIAPSPESHDADKPQNVESNEISTSAPIGEVEQIETEKPVISSIEAETEKGVLATEKPHETTAPEEEFILATTKATTLKVEEEPTTSSPLEDKFGKPDEAPKPTVEAEKPKPDTTEELPKPGANDIQPTEEALQPDDESHFPPSGTSGYGQEPDYGEEDSFGPGTCRYGGKVYVSAQQIPRDDPCDFCFCFRSDIICLQQSCPPPIHGCHEEPIQGFCCPRYECPVSMATSLNVTTTTTTTTTTLPPHFLPHAYKGAAQRRGCQIKGHTYKVGEVVRASSGPCLHCTCGGDGQMKCDPKVCTPEPMLRQMIAAAVSAKRRR